MSGMGRSQRTSTQQHRAVEDGAYAKALQDEYQKECTRRQQHAEQGGGSIGSRSKAKGGSTRNGGRDGKKKKKNKKKKKHNTSSGGREGTKNSHDERERDERKRRRRRNGNSGGGGGRRRSTSQRHSNNNSRSHGRRSHSSRSHNRSSSVDSFKNSFVSRTSSRQQQQQQIGNDNNIQPTIVSIPAPYMNSLSSSRDSSSSRHSSSHHRSIANKSSDEDYARQMQAQWEQEEVEQSRRDADLARRISTSSGRTPPSTAQSRVVATQQPQSRSWWTRANDNPRVASTQKEMPIPIFLPPPPPPPSPKYTDVNTSKFLSDDRYSTTSGFTAPSTEIDDDEAVARRIQHEQVILANAHRLVVQQETVATTNQRRPPCWCVAKFGSVCLCLSFVIALPLLILFVIYICYLLTTIGITN